jgi:hypothetical protein
MSYRIAMLAMLALVPAALAGQSIDERLGARVPRETAALVRELAASAAARGLPADPIVQKAIEGSVKAVPADRVAGALREVLTQLELSAAALRGAGMDPPDTIIVAAGAFAINTGLDASQVRELARAGPATGAAVTLRVAGTLAALGVPAADVVQLVATALGAGQAPADLLALPARVQAAMARGQTPAQAAAGLARAAAASGRRGPPPTRPTPPPRPQRP